MLDADVIFIQAHPSHPLRLDVRRLSIALYLSLRARSPPRLFLFPPLDYYHLDPSGLPHILSLYHFNRTPLVSLSGSFSCLLLCVPYTWGRLYLLVIHIYLS